MRTVADSEQPDSASLLVEVASLVQQTAGLLESQTFVPRMEVAIP
jgi:hypothetical protein